MKLNHECIRAVLLTIEERSQYIEDHIGCLKALYIDDLMEVQRLNIFDKNSVFYAVSKLNEAGFVNATMITSAGMSDYKIYDLSFEGHQYLDSIRNDRVWNKVKEQITTLGGSLPFELIKTLGITYIKSLFS